MGDNDQNQNVVPIETQIKEYPEAEFPDFRNQILGSGGEAIVCKSFHKKLGEVAIKVHTSPKRFMPGASSNLENDLLEAQLLFKHSRHPNIVEVYGLLIAEKIYFSKYIGYIMAFMKCGSLYRVIHDPKINYSMKQVFSWIKQAALGLQYLHGFNIIHRDVKPENFLLGETIDNLKISDFGLARPLDAEAVTSNITKGIGTYIYMSPELIDSQKYSYPADIYALTISIWEMANRRKPYHHLAKELLSVIYTQIVKNDERPKIESVSPLNPLLLKGWDKNPTKRPQLSEFLDFSQRGFDEANDTEMIPIGGVARAGEQPDHPPPKKLTKEEINLDDSEHLILIAGGKVTDSASEDSIFIFDYKNNSWLELSTRLPYKTHGHAMQILNGELYVFGGSDEDEAIRETYKLDENTAEWKEAGKMIHKRYGIMYSSVVFDGCLWVVGGWNSFDTLKSVEKYDPIADKWTLLPGGMSIGRVSGSAAEFQGKIYAFGGGRSLDLEVMDPETGVWTIFCPFPKIRQGLTHVMNSNNLMIFGGWNGKGCSTNSWQMNLSEKQPKSEELPDMIDARTDFTIHIIGHEIVAFGGCKKYHEPINTVESFDGKSWKIRASLPENKAFHSSVQITPQIMATLTKIMA